MDLHVIVEILLTYFPDQSIKIWSKTRILNTAIKKIVDNQKYNRDVWGRSSFIHTSFCEMCEKKNPKIKMLIYPADDKGSARIISHCDNWMCNVSAILSMIDHYKNDNIYLLKKPFQKSTNVIIPRSDGSENEGHCKNNCVVKRKNKWYIFTHWYEDEFKFTKLIPLEHYTEKSPEIMFE